MSPSHREMQQVNSWTTPYHQKRVEVKHHCSTHLIGYSLRKIDYILTERFKDDWVFSDAAIMTQLED